MFRCRQFWVNDFFFTKKVYRTLAFTDLLWITFLLSAVLRWDIIKLIFTEKVILDLDVYKGFLYITFLLSTVLRWYIIKLIFTEKVHIWLGRIKVFCVSWWKRNIIASLHFNWNKTIRKNWQTKAFQFSQRAAFHVCFIFMVYKTISCYVLLKRIKLTRSSFNNSVDIFCQVYSPLCEAAATVIPIHFTKFRY